jgi:hypothetical protein
MAAQPGPAGGHQALCVMCGEGPITGGSDISSILQVALGRQFPEAYIAVLFSLPMCVRAHVRVQEHTMSWRRVSATLTATRAMLPSAGSAPLLRVRTAKGAF